MLFILHVNRSDNHNTGHLQTQDPVAKLAISLVLRIRESENQ